MRARLMPTPGRTSTRATAKGCFAVATRAMPRRRAHLVAGVRSLWWMGKFDGLMASTHCGRRLVSVSIHAEAPEPFELCDDCVLADYSGHCVYRLFDAADRLLYVGCTGNLWSRIASHSTSTESAPFWPQVVRISHEKYADRASALAAEKRAIQAELPPFNLDHTDRAKNRGPRRGSSQGLLAVAT